MSKVNKQRNRFEKYSVLLRYFCRERVLSTDITSFFNNKIVKELIENNIFTLNNVLALDKNSARNIFHDSTTFRSLVDALNKLCEKEIPEIFEQFKDGNAYLLIEPFDVLDQIIDTIGTRLIDYKYTDFTGVEKSLNSEGIFTYQDILNVGIAKIDNIKGFGAKGYEELSNIINGEKIRLETGRINHTKKWLKKESSPTQSQPVPPSNILDIALIKQDPKVKSVHINAIKRIYNNITKLINAKHTSALDKQLKDLGASPYCYNYAYKHKLMTLNDIYRSLNRLVKVYGHIQSRLKNLAENVAKISTDILKGNNKRKKPASKTKKDKAAKSPKKPTSNSLLTRINNRSGDNCCLCLTMNELLKITERDFVTMMKKQYPKICEFKLSSGRVKSWRDEYNQFVKCFIPTFRKYDRKTLNYYVIFELMLPKYTTDLDTEEFIYSDAVIVGDDGFVILEFKERPVVAVEQFSSQALKYIKRLKYHKIGRKQHFRFTYLVYTQEEENGIWVYENKKNYWYGTPKSIANDICHEFFDNNNPYAADILEWKDAGFKEKHHRK